ncbi:hypothetical protein, conserved, partial [Babesia bigemina]
MGFLSGVLGAVKDDTNVASYYYITKDKLNNFNKFLYTGHSNFSHFISYVSCVLSDYDIALKRKTDEVRISLESLKEQIELGKKSIEQDRFRDISKQVSEWTRRADKYISKATDADNALRKIDLQLSCKLNVYVKSVVQATEGFKRCAENNDLNVLNELAENHMAKVTAFISSQSKRLMMQFYAYLENCIGALYMSLESLKNCDFNDLDTSVYPDLCSAFDLVKIGMDDLLIKYDKEIVSGVKSIAEDVLALKSTVTDEKKKLALQVSSLQAQITSLKDLRTLVVPPSTTFDEYQSDAEDNKWNLHKQIQSVTLQIVNSVKGCFATLPSDISAALKKYTNRIADADDNSSDDEDGYLDKIESGVVTYVGTFENFDSKVQEWVTDILKKDKIVNDRYLKRYVSTNIRESYFKIRDSTHMHGILTTAVRTALTRYITAAGEKVRLMTAESRPNETIAFHLRALKEGIEHFVGQLGMVLDDRVGAIVDDVEDQLGVEDGKSSPGKSHLTYAIRILLHQLHSVARQAGNDAAALLNETFVNMANVDKSIVDVKALSSTIEAELTPDDSSHDYSKLGNQMRNKLINAATDDNEVKNKMKDLLREACIRGIDELQAQITKIVAGKFTDGRTSLEGIKSELVKLQTKEEVDITTTHADGGDSLLEKQAHGLHVTVLNFLRDKIGESATPAQSSVHNDMKRLLRNVDILKQNVANVKKRVCAVGEKLEKCIIQAEELITETTKEATRSFDRLRDAVNIIVERAFNDIQKEARIRYTETKRKEVDALMNIVTDQLTSITKTISDDLATGVKGFIKTLKDGTTKNLSSMQGKNIGRLKKFGDLSSQQEYDRRQFTDLAEAFHDFCQPLHTYLLGEITRANLNNSGTTPNYSARLKSIFTAFSTLLPHLREANKYDHRVPSMLSNLRDALTVLKPDGFSTPNSSTLDCITSGLTKFADELDKAYISVYDGQGFEGKVVEETGTVEVYTTGVYPVYLSTEYGKKCAKVFCTALEILFHDLSELREECKRDWKDLNICMHPGEDIENGLASYLKNCGYGVPSKQGVQDGELRYGESWTGESIRATLLIKQHDATLTRTAFRLVY